MPMCDWSQTCALPIWISLQSKGLSRVFSNTTVQKHQFFGTQPSSQSNSRIMCNPIDGSPPGCPLGPHRRGSLGFSRQEHWSGLPFPPPGDLPDRGIGLASPALAGRLFPTEPPGKPRTIRGISVFLPGESHGQRSLAGYSPWDSQESSSTPQFKSINSSALSLLHSPTLKIGRASCRERV